LKYIKVLLMAAVILYFPFTAVDKKQVYAETVTMELYYDGYAHAYSAEEVFLSVNGNLITQLAMPPIILNDYTLVPAREVFEPMGAIVEWEAESSTVHILHRNNRITLRINDTYASVNGQAVAMVVPAKIINDKTMIPLRFVADSLNFLVFWDDAARTACIDDLSYYYADPGYVVAEPAPPDNPADFGPTILGNIRTSDSGGSVPARDVSTHEITAEDHPETSIVEFETPTDGNRFTIRASSAISRINTHLLSDNRMYIDIFNAVTRLPVSFYPVPDNPGVGSARAAQNQLAPEMITRVVFDLKDGAEYNVTMSADRTEIYVDFMKNTIIDVELYAEGAYDLIVITGQFTPSVSVVPSHEPETLYIDIPYASVYGYMDKTADGRYVRGIGLSLVNGDTARITLTLSEGTMYDIQTDSNSAAIRLSGKTYQNIEYDMAQKRLVIKKDGQFPMDIHNFTHTDNYFAFTYTIGLGGDYGYYLGNGDYAVRDSMINAIKLRTENGNTYLEFNVTGIYAFDVYEDYEYIYIQPLHPKQKHPKIVILDPGHGGNDEGATGHGMIEKDLNLDIARRVMALFDGDGHIKAYATRVTDINPELDERIEFGTNLGDLYVSLHNNFAPMNVGSRVPNPGPSGSETFFYPHEYEEFAGITSEAAAVILQRHVAGAFGSLDRGAKQMRYYVLANARIPAVLIEIGFMTNEGDAMKLASEEYKQKTAEAVYAGILEIFNNYRPAR